MLIYRAARFAALFLILLTTDLFAQDVTLASRDGTIEITGALVGYDGEFYRVDTVYGVLTVDGSGVLCSGPGCPDLALYVANIRFSGAASVGSVLMPRLIDAFAARHKYSVERQIADDASFSFHIRNADDGQKVAIFSFRISNSDEGFADLISQEADIAMSGRAATQKETRFAREAGLGRLDSLKQARVIALDALVPVVAGSNPVGAISPTDLYHAFAGQLSNWQDLGGVDALIEPHLGQANMAEAQVFHNYMAQLTSSPAAAVTRHATPQHLVGAVSRDPFAIGVTRLSDMGNTKPLTLKGRCGFLSLATPETLRTRDYPLVAPLFIYLPARRLPTIGREFLRYIGSPQAQAAIERAGFTSQRLSEIPVSQQGNRLTNAIRAAGEEVLLSDLQSMVAALEGANRLAVSFRFEDGSRELDAQSRSNIALIANALETGDFDDKEILFVGFSDGGGSALSNVRLSRERAASVRSAILQQAITADLTRLKLTVEAFGETMPMACDDTEWGRQINRRVEVWVR